MKQFTKAAILAMGVVLASQAAKASFTANDLYLGFSSASASADYLIDLGQPDGVGIGGSTPVYLSGDLSASLFNSAFASGPLGVNMGVVGGQNQFPSSYDLYATALRVGGPGDATVAGSDLSGFSHSAVAIGNAEVTLTGNPFPTAGNGAVDPSKSWTANIAPTFTSSSFYGASGINPNSAIDSSNVLYEDLWNSTPNNPFTYLGYFTLDVSGADPILSFTPSTVAVPEPTSAALMTGAGLMLLILQRRMKGEIS
jgi:hypothetical protein